MVVNNRIWIVGAALIMVVVVLLGWFLGASPRLGEVAANEVQRQAAVTQNQAYAAELAALKEDFENIDTFRAELDELQDALPSGSGLARFIGSLRDLEAASGVVLTNFTSADAEPFVYLETVPAAPAPAATTEAEGDAATEAPATPVGPAPKLVQTLSPDEFVSIQINLVVTGTQAQVIDFVDALQHAKRRFLVTTLSVTTEDAATGQYTGTIGGSVYVLIDPNKPADAEDEQDVPEPAPSASPTPSSSPSPSGSPTP